MSLAVIESLREQPGRGPSPKARAAIAAAFESDPAAAWEAYVGRAHAWVAPADAASPWSAPTVQSVWSPQAKAMKSFIKVLAKQTLGLMVRDHVEGWQLGYVVELGTKKGQDYQLELWVGGPANSAPEVQGQAAQGEWLIPDSLASIYAVHDGFGRAGPAWGVEALLPARGLESLPALIGTSNDGSPMIEDHSLLAFFVDSVGDRRGLYRQGGAQGLVYKHGFHWDRQTKEVAKAGSVPSVVGRELAKVLRGA